MIEAFIFLCYFFNDQITLKSETAATFTFLNTSHVSVLIVFLCFKAESGLFFLFYLIKQVFSLLLTAFGF